MRLFLLFLFPFFLGACHQPHATVATRPPAVPAETIATVIHAAEHNLDWTDIAVAAATVNSPHSGSNPDYTKYRYEWRGKMYEGVEHEDIYLAEGDKFIVLIPDTLRPYESKLLLENPVFGEQELITLRAGYVRGASEKCIVYDYEYNGRRYRKQLYKRDAPFSINGGMTPKQLILVLVDPANPARSIAVPDEILSREDSVRYSLPHSLPQLNYGMWLSRGVVTGTPDTLVDAVGAYCYVPDTTELHAMKNLVGEWQFPYVRSQRLAVQQQQERLLRENGVPLYYTHKKKIGLRMPDSSVMILDLAAYQNSCSIALFSGYAPPQVRDGYIDSRAYVYKNYFGGR
ncbi:MAG TPA: hypothetical protein VFU15_09960 [Bacteroidia bacterium]|nr:hypothetical protein [Bacteroidia bacterium]